MMKLASLPSLTSVGAAEMVMVGITGIGIGVGVAVGVTVGVGLGVAVGVAVGVTVGDAVAVGLGVAVGVEVGVAVAVGVGVGAALARSYPITSRLIPSGEASVRSAICPGHANASCTCGSALGQVLLSQSPVSPSES